MERVVAHTELAAYRSSFRLQQAIFESSKHWPRAETFSLIDQIRRSSRAVGANLAESWAKRRYPAHFLSKLTDADGELQETRHWLETARACGYLDPSEHADLAARIDETGQLLGGMLNRYRSFCP